MPDLLHMLVDHDPAMVKIIAGKWGMELQSTGQLSAAKELVLMMLNPEEVMRIVELLPADSRECLSSICRAGGKLSWQDFVRRNGPIREMGIARREREAPHEHPSVMAEVLWYYGLIGRAFFDVSGELVEFAYIPEDLLKLLPGLSNTTPDLPVASMDQNSFRTISKSNDFILDHLTSYLAAVRSGNDPHELVDEFKQPSIMECRQLLSSCQILDDHGDPLPRAVKSYLAIPRGEALCLLFTKWLSSSSFNELKLMPGMIFEGIWKNDPLRARQTIFEKIRALGGSGWWSIDSFIMNIKNSHPDFQRTGGDYDSWMIRSGLNGSSLRGYQYWDQVDGNLIRYILQGPLHWLGYLDLAAPMKGSAPGAFRVSRFAEYLDRNQPPSGLLDERGHITALRNGMLTCPRDVPRSVRYLLARFCERAGINDKGYLYRITSRSLKQAASQGLVTGQLIALLSRHCGGAMPASLAKALQGAASNGFQASIRQVAILQVATPEIMQEIRSSPVGRFLGDLLSPTIVTLPPTAVEKIVPRLMELGYVCDLDEGGLRIQQNKG
jgi:hypothetical protein